MADIYREARQVVIFDALCLRLRSTDPVKVAVVTCLGTWMTRMWTYQEIKLATNAIIATKTGFVSFSSITQSLKTFALNEVGEEYKIDTPGKYPSLAKTIGRLQRNDDLGVSLPDFAIGCGYREAWDRLDYARALFPTLGIDWKTKYDIHDAMERVYQTQKKHASRLALFHGPPRANFPGWAPAVFNGLVDCKIIEPSIWKSRGMQREWLTTKILSIVPSKPGALVLKLESDFAEGAMSAGFISEQTQKESPESVEFFRKAVSGGTAYLLADEPLVPKRHFSRVGLLVARFTELTDLEAWVCLTLAVGETEETYKYEKRDWLLLHENPVSTHFSNGQASTQTTLSIIQSTKLEASPDLVYLPLHRAAMNGNVDECLRLLPTTNVNATDSRGWTALHMAAAADQQAVISLLIGAGADVNAFVEVNGQTPLILAVDNGHLDTAMALWEAGADVNLSHKNGLGSPLCVAARKKDGIEMVNLLLAIGANPSLVDAAGWAPIQCAIRAEEGSTEALEALLEAGGDPDTPSHGVLTAIDLAARFGNHSTIRKLLQYKADPNLTFFGHDPPLYQAIESGSLESVRALLDGGEYHSVRSKNGWTPMMLAAKGGDYEMGRLLQAKGAGLNDVDDMGVTVLHVAALNGSRVFYKWLLEAGAKKDARDASGRTASDVAVGF